MKCFLGRISRGPRLAQSGWRHRRARGRIRLPVTALVGLIVAALTAPARPQLTVARTVFFNPDEGCAALQDVLDSLSPDSLVKIGPGDIWCGTTSLTIPNGVTVEGAGRDSTSISGDRSSANFGVVDFDNSFATLRDVEVVHAGGGNFSIAVTVFDSTVTFEQVRILSLAASQASAALRVLGGTPGSLAKVHDSELRASPAAADTEVYGDGEAEVLFYSSRLAPGVYDSSEWLGAGRHLPGRRGAMRRFLRPVLRSVGPGLPASSLNGAGRARPTQDRPVLWVFRGGR